MRDEHSQLSGFSAEWLALRAAADRRSRSQPLLAVLRRRVVATPARPLRIVDLGAGTGSTLAAVAPLLPRPQQWTLADDEAALLRIAATGRRPSGTSVRTAAVDLADPRALPGLMDGTHVVTASALLDLTSRDWCRRLVRLMARRSGAVLYAALTYDGRIVFDPPEPFDAPLCRLFNRHQRGDKGFGAALGPAAAPELAALAAAAGAAVRTAPSDWRLGAADAALVRPMIRGWAAAAREVAPEQETAITAWAARRTAQAGEGRLRVRIGHRDVLACW